MGDAVCLATGNDRRAIEADITRTDGQYRPLTDGRTEYLAR